MIEKMSKSKFSLLTFYKIKQSVRISICRLVFDLPPCMFLLPCHFNLITIIARSLMSWKILIWRPDDNLTINLILSFSQSLAIGIGFSFLKAILARNVYLFRDWCSTSFSVFSFPPVYLSSFTSMSHRNFCRLWGCLSHPYLNHDSEELISFHLVCGYWSNLKIAASLVGQIKHVEICNFSTVGGPRCLGVSQGRLIRFVSPWPGLYFDTFLDILDESLDLSYYLFLMFLSPRQNNFPS